jgi:Gliding motility associated protein GldN
MQKSKRPKVRYMYQSTRFSSNKLKFTTRQINLPTTLTHMKALQLLFLLPLSILCSKSTAQVDDLMRNKDITWIVESSSTVVIDQRMEGKIDGATNFVTPLKYINTTERAVSEEFTLQNIILEAIKQGKLKIYRDRDCKEPMTYDDACQHDSILSINPNTYETEVKVVANTPLINRLVAFRTHQIVYYNTKKAQFGVRILAIALMVKHFDSNGKDYWFQSLFWMKATDLTKKRRLSDKNITWAKQINLNNGIYLRSDSAEIMKRIGHYEPTRSLFDSFRSNPKISFYKPNGTEITEKFSEVDKMDFINRNGIDTIQSVDPTTYEMKTKIVYSQMNHDDISHLQLIQNWYWNDKKKRLEIWLYASAPLKNVRSSNGEYMFRIPYFYRRTDD